MSSYDSFLHLRAAVPLSICFLIGFPVAGSADATDEQAVDFNRDVRPILADKCFHCHGPDPGTREADLRLDQQTGAKDGVIVGGKSSESELIRRLLSDDADEVMPPPDSGKEVTPEQIEVLKRWIDSGAEWSTHWSFERPVMSPLPAVTDVSWPKNAIDNFVMGQLDREKLKPSPEVRRETLARRVAFDLTGLPPTPERVQGFVNDSSPQAYEQLVDELLHSKHYGERMAMAWLDAARYADSDGYQADATRQNWPWRDWVIDAYNSNMPFDQFTIEQFAGDLMQDATPEQILATCFHRNHMHNGEGGRDPEESRTEYVIDRVNTVGTVWLGLTLGCAQCHSHKYDPVSQTEYYQLNAFFNSIDESGKAGGGAAPFLKYNSPYAANGLQDSIDWLQQVETRLQQVRQEELAHFDDWVTQQQTHIAAAKEDFSSWKSFAASEMGTTGGTTLQQADLVYSVSGQDPRHNDYLITVAPQLPRVTRMRLSVFPSADAGGRLSRFQDGHIILTNLKVRRRSADGTRESDVAISDTVATHEAAKGGRIYGPINTVLDDDPRSGWMTTGSPADEKKIAAFVFKEPIVLAEGESLVVELRQRSLRGYSNLQRFTLEFTDEFGPAAKSLDITPLERLASVNSSVSGDLRKLLEAQFLADRPRIRDAQDARDKGKRRKGVYDSASKSQNVTVLKERSKPRDMHILVRGVWNNKGDSVQPATPLAISTAGPAPSNRMELAQWLVSRDNPLTARIAVNRYWQMYFGYGLVRTPGDFGTQGEPPTHPKLLDWLAAEFMESGWDIKHIQRLIVTSATYRQSSMATPEQLTQDPDNRRLARASRFRLPSWMIRDAALASSGLLSDRVGGPPVYPFQPEGAWLDATMGRFRYEVSVGSDLYRRSIYTFWRRSVGPTGMFDASKRRVCEVRSVRTNTPLQALTLMNDETFAEAAKMLADSAVSRHTAADDRVSSMFQRVLLRLPSEKELAVLTHQLRTHIDEYKRDLSAAAALVSVGQSPVGTKDVQQVAAFMLLASTILNLDEAITHE
ncbi:MAG: PSD1 and planctomycete cytochrome C domain-containing protein [Fuerstiella sp.]|nr:PSD1 and planctomycete cytochrome C domain-containing protein [Fuerstiella sp.]